MEGAAVGHNFEMRLPKDYPSQICFNLVQGFSGEDLNVIFYQNIPNCLTYILGFSVKFFFQTIFTDYAN
jgi:hypothetical protein